MNERIEALKKGIFITPGICVERGQLVTDSYQETEGMPIILRRARALRKVLEDMTIYIADGELIVGNMASQPRSAPLFPEFSIDFIEEELDDFAQRPYDKFLVTTANKQKIRKMIRYWRGKTYSDTVKSLYESLLSSEFKKGWDNKEFQTVNKVITCKAHSDAGDGHVIPNYERLLHIGFFGIIKEIQLHLSRLDPANPQDIRPKLFLEAAQEVCEAATKFANRYAQLARELASQRSEQKVELLKIANTCCRVATQPARTFHEALQLIWLAHIIVQIESNGHAIGFGRLDQVLYPFYRRDMKKGILNRAQALELIECLFIKSCEINKLRPWGFTRHMSGYGMFQNINLGGQTGEGKDATNELSYLFLEATAEMRLHQPTIIVRVHEGTPQKLLVQACAALARHGNLPAFYNDLAIVPGILNVIKRGNIRMSVKEARDYAVIGCGEPVIPGKSIPVTGGTTHVNLSKIMELALNKGIDPTTGTQLCPDKRDLGNFTSFGEVLEALKKQIEYHLRYCPILDNAQATSYGMVVPTPFLSSLIDYRIDIARDVTEAEGSLNYTVMHGPGIQGGPVNVVNSLAAIKKLVFEEKTISGQELKTVLSHNFQGNGEIIRQRLLNEAPKYGNDIEYVDLLMKDLLSMCYQEIEKYRTIRGVFAPHTQSISANVPYGEVVGATADGRKAGEPLADNISPHPGTDTNGPTAVIKSAAKVDHSSFIHGNILNLKFHPLTIRGENGLNNLAALIRTYFGLGGFQVQFNIVSAAILKEAMKYPDKHQDLIVKVAGYSAQFISLDKKLQEQIISRTEQSFA